MTELRARIESAVARELCLDELVALVLRYLIEVWHVRDATDVLIEWTRPAADRLRADVRDVFGDLRVPGEGLLTPVFATSEDAGLLANAIRGKRWTEITTRELFVHRECLGMLSPAAYRACLPACLLACLDGVVDICEYLLFGLAPLDDTGRVRMRERLTLLTPAELGVLREVVAYLAVRYGERDAELAAAELSTIAAARGSCLP
ncbi:MAG: hypothetical protein ABI867_01840 [Kofleriaceae bacterium]